jgi:hypothetical protein
VLEATAVVTAAVVLTPVTAAAAVVPAATADFFAWTTVAVAFSVAGVLAVEL